VVLLYVTLPILPDMKLMSHFLSLLCTVVLRIFCISWCLGVVSNALFMSMANSRVLFGGLGWLKPSSICCVRSVNRGLVE
jgi:hypothetical protein